MATVNIKATLESDLQTVWEIVTKVEQYPTWRTDIQKTEVLPDKQFAEISKEGYRTIFAVTATEPCKRWEFDIENDNMTGHWIGLFTEKGQSTEISFTEQVVPKKFFLKPFVKAYLTRQQKQFVTDLKMALDSKK